MAKRKRRSTQRDTTPSSDLPNAPLPESEVYSRRELVIVAFLLLLGIGLRVAFPSRMAVEHFDEGVYASNFWFGPESDYRYPMRHLYAPPLLPSCIEWSMILNLAGKESPRDLSPIAPIIPSLIAGCLTLLVVWRMSRDWFGPQAALASLTLASLSDIHALYSRTALTDAMLLLFFVSAIWAMHRAMAQNSYLHLGIAGLLTGLAWWTKYNGWLPLAVGFGGLVVAFTIDQTYRRNALRLIGFAIGVAAIAFAVWSPYLRDLQAYGGYAEVAANHKQYVVGFAGWWSSLMRQHSNLKELDGVPSLLAIGVATVIAGGLKQRGRTFIIALTAIALASATTTIWTGHATILLLIAFLFGTYELYRRWSANDAATVNDSLAIYLLAAWITGLFLATPMYYPYPRLTLPLIAGTWIVVGYGCSRIVNLTCSESFLSRSKQSNIALGIMIIVSIIHVPRLASTAFPTWQSRVAWQPIAKDIVNAVGDRALSTRGNRDEAMVVVYGEPGLFYHLNVSGTQLFAPGADLSFTTRTPQDSTVPIFLVTGPHAEQTAGFQEDLARHKSHLEQIAEYDYSPSLLVRLNQADPDATTHQRVTVYRVK